MQKFFVQTFLTIYFCNKKKLPQYKLLQKWIVKKTARKINRCKNALQAFLYICYWSVAKRSRLLIERIKESW